MFILFQTIYHLQLILQPDRTSDPLPVQALVEEIETAMTVFAHGLNDLVKDRGETPESKASLLYLNN